MWTRQQLADHLRRLGVMPGDTLFTHSSFKSIGPVDGDAETVVNALEDAVGPEGLILMPSFHLIEWDERAKIWNHDSTPSTVGWLTEFFRLMPGTVRSDHYSHSVAARGHGAAQMVEGHLRRQGLRSAWDREPWGFTYGLHSPMYQAYANNGVLLMLGVDYQSSTFLHLAEVMIWNRLLELDDEVEFVGIDRPAAGLFWDGLGRLKSGKLGDADCRLFSIADYVDTIVVEVEKNPQPYLPKLSSRMKKLLGDL
jgi:aminoglycoside N3'-acetyltransferase